MPVHFKTVFVNYGNAYDSSKNRFCPAKKGFYWFHFDTFTDNYLNVNYSMTNEEGIDYITGLVKTARNRAEVDVLSKDTIVNLDTMDCFRMDSFCATTNFTSSLYVMTWAGFFIESEVVFSLATNVALSENLQIANFSFITLNSGKFYLK